MKRLLPLMLTLMLLCGCAAKEPAAPETPQAPPAASSAVPQVPGASSIGDEAQDDELGTVEISIWDVTADGSLSPADAAAEMVEQIAENYRNIPDWVEWKPVDVQAEQPRVFDVYLGQPEQFCADYTFRVQIDRVTAAQYGHWQAGGGLGEADSEGYCGYGFQVRAVKNEEGDWECVERGTGGYRMVLPRKDGEDNLDALVGDFFLTEGESHDWHIPYAILERSESEMAELPVILTRRGEQDAKELCAALGKCLKEFDYWTWNLETLKEALGSSYGAYLDA